MFVFAVNSMLNPLAVYVFWIHSNDVYMPIVLKALCVLVHLLLFVVHDSSLCMYTRIYVVLYGVIFVVYMIIHHACTFEHFPGGGGDTFVAFCT